MTELDDKTPPAERDEQWDKVGEAFTRGVMLALQQGGAFDKAAVGQSQTVLSALIDYAFQAVPLIGLGLAKTIAASEDALQPRFAEFAAAAASDVFDVDVPVSAFTERRGGRAGGGGGAALGRGLMELMKGDVTTLQPSDAAAAKYVSAVAGMALEDWFKGWFFEVVTSLIPQVDVGKIENYGALGDKVANMLGLTGVSRRVFRPIVDATVITPLEWHTNKTYRPRLLSATQCARQIARRPETADTWLEELRRQGYREDQIEALRNESRRYFSAADVRQFVSRQHWTGERGEQHLIDQGYTLDEALDALRLEGLRRVEKLEADEAAAIVGAYVARDIDEGTFRSALATAVQIPSERAFITELADLRRSLNIKRLSLSQVEAMVKSGVLGERAYRQAAARDGYPEDDIDALVLQLRSEIDKQKKVEQHRAERLAKVREREALARRGSEGDLERAAIRGIIPLARVAELYAAKYDTETVDALLGELDARRLEHLELLAHREEARKRAAVRGVSVEQLEQAVARNILTLDEFRRRLADLQFAADDADVLTETLRAKLADAAAAAKLRAAAAAAAKTRHVSLATIETLVRRGHRPMDAYDRTLADLGFDEAARAAMVELLQDRIDEDAAARAIREAAAAADTGRDVSLAQYRRAVVLGVRSVDQFQAYLVTQQYTSDAALLLVDELRADVAGADAARARREAADAGVDSRALSLARVRRAARLGLLPIADYRARLTGAGYSDADSDLELDLLVEEIKADAAARAARQAVTTDAGVRDPTLAQLETAVRQGIRSIEEYRQRVTALGYRPDDVDLLVQLLQLELEATRDGLYA